MGKPKQDREKEHLTPQQARAAMDVWAADASAIAQHNLRVLEEELVEYARVAGIDLEASGGLEAARKARAKDAGRGRKFRGGKGRPPTKPPEVLRSAVAKGHERHPGKTWSKICEDVGREYGVSRQAVARHTREISWAKEVP